MKYFVKFAMIALAMSAAGCSSEIETQPVDVGIKITPALLTVRESGQQASFKISFDQKPVSMLVIQAAVSSPDECRIEPAGIKYDPALAPADPQFTVTGIDDKIADGDQHVKITLTLSSADPNFKNIQPIDIPVTVVDIGAGDDTQPDPELFDIVVPQDSATNESGKSVEGAVSLKKAPASDVKITLTSSDTTEGTISPASLIFTAENYSVPQKFTVKGADDSEKDGDVAYTVTGSAVSSDPAFNAGEIFKYEIVNKDDEKAPDPGSDGTKIRFMAANITAGKGQSYDGGEGIRIMQAFKPDIVMIQEFNYASGQRSLVDTAFGPEYHFTVGKGRIPNGVISKYPITDSGTWDSNSTSDREWEWATIDIPGNRDLLAVSVHLSGKKHNNEFRPLLNKIQEKQKESNYYVVLGGDFNTKFNSGDHNSLYNVIGTFFHVGAPGTDSDKCIGGELPLDQNNSRCTSGERDDPYDWVLFDKDLDAFEIPITVGSRTYQNGHVIDSRIYEQHGELDLIPPVKAADSYLCYGDPFCKHSPQDQKTNMQHQAVIRDIVLPQK